MVILEIFPSQRPLPRCRARVEIARLGCLAPAWEAAKLAGPGAPAQRRRRPGAGESHRTGSAQDSRPDRRTAAGNRRAGCRAQDQRARRQERQGLACVALVGYTNAGKSTLMRALTGSEVLVANKLFATLDTTVRASTRIACRGCW